MNIQKKKRVVCLIPETFEWVSSNWADYPENKIFQIS